MKDIPREGTMALRIFAAASLLLVAAAVQAQTAARPPAQPAAWGPSPGYTTVMAHGFSTDFAYSEGFSQVGVEQYLGATYCDAGVGNPGGVIRAHAQLDLPDGSTLSQLQMWAYDVDAADGLTVELWETCQPAGFNAPSSTLLGSVDSVGAIGTYFGFTPLNGHRVDAGDCAYTVRVSFNATCKGSAIQLQKAQVSWVRDVAPGPSSATFADVPTSHPFFQYVEALAGSGVTGGCGNGDFCPDLPLTRGQMAVFLSKALGLEWP